MNLFSDIVDTPDLSGFNPHSPLLANEFIPDDLAVIWLMVSIHIRHCWRMNFGGGGCDSGGLLFQSTFAIAGE